MSDLPPPPSDAHDEPTRHSDATQPEPRPSGELPRRGYDDEPRRMKPPPPPRRGKSQPPPPGIGSTSPNRAAGGPPPRRTPPPQRPRTKADSGLYLPWWSLLVLVGIVALGACGLIYAVAQYIDDPAIGDQNPRFVVVTQENFSGNNNQGAANGEFVPPGNVPPSAAPIQTSVPQANPTSTTSPDSAAGCPLNTLIEVTGTGGDGLLIREEPRQGDNIIAVARDGDRFFISSGPEQSIGVAGESIEWCQITDAEDESTTGWAAVDFMQVVNE